VHATLVDSTIAAYDAWLEPLPRDRRAGFYAETRAIGRLFGIPESLLPADLDAFEEYLAAMLAPSGPVHPTATARAIAAAILHPPLGPVVRPLAWLPAPAYSWLLWPALGLLPSTLRAEFGLGWGAPQRAVSAWLVPAWRAWRPILPPGFRQMPQALAADRRVSRAWGNAARTSGRG
jgi:uncharacterized protein (DUF2236 family)